MIPRVHRLRAAARASCRNAKKSTTFPSSRSFASLPHFFPSPPVDPRRRASTSASNTDWLSWLKKASALSLTAGSSEKHGGKALLFAGLGSYPHTPQSPTASSISVWEEASEALLEPDATIGYWTDGMEEFAGYLQEYSGRGVRGWLRGWVEGRTLDELMSRADVTASFILTSSIAILASEKERSGSSSLLPPNTTHLAGHGFIGTLTAIVAAGRLDLATGVRLARMYASLPAAPYGSNATFATIVLSARYFHSLSSPSEFIPFEDPILGTKGTASESSAAPEQRRRAMQLILDVIHGLQREWAVEGKDWAEAGIINSSKVLIVTGTELAVEQVVDRLQSLTLANPVMDVHMPCPYNTRLMEHAVPKFRDVLERCYFHPPRPNDPVAILDPVTTHPIGSPAPSLAAHLTSQMRWHKTLRRLYKPPVPDVSQFLTVGRGAKGLGTMLRGELKNRQPGASNVEVVDFGVKEKEVMNVRSVHSGGVGMGPSRLKHGVNGLSQGK